MEHEVFAVYISPTGSTREAVRALCKGLSHKLSDDDFYSVDLTSRDARRGNIQFSEGDVVVVGTPTYAGRIPNKLMPYIQDCVIGNGAYGIALATYGNRAYDDSLKEIAYLMDNNGFDVISAISVPSEHAFTDKLATGRPNASDLDRIYNLGISLADRIIKDKVSSLNIDSVKGHSFEELKYYVPRKEDGEPASFLKAMPKTDRSKCDGCLECKYACPMDCFSESISEPSGTCIKCQACIKACPQGAKYFDDSDFISHVRFLEKNYANATNDIEVFGEC